MTEQQCPDCKIVETHDEVLDPYRVIEFCDTHAAAFVMLAALKKTDDLVYRALEMVGKGGPASRVLSRIQGIVQKALASARGEGGSR